MEYNLAWFSLAFALIKKKYYVSSTADEIYIFGPAYLFFPHGGTNKVEHHPES